jgi:transketolase
MAGKASRAAFGEALIDLGARDERIVTVDADLSKSTMTAKFAKTYPGRAFNVGIAESTMIGMAAGLALTGRIPFACSFACFLAGRFETIRVSVAYSQAVAWAVEHPGPVYLRLTRQNLEPVHGEDYRFQFGRADVLRPGSDVSILATGGPLWNALEAARRLEADGIQAEVLNVATIKPLDEETILRSAGKTGRVVTVEDHSVSGGLGGAVAELLSEVMPTPLRKIGVHGFGESGDLKGLYAKHGLDPGGIATTVRKFLAR